MESKKDTENNNRLFWIGFSLVWVAFVVANIVSYSVEYAAFLTRQENSMKLSFGGYSWGFPFKMYRNFVGFPNIIGFDLLPTVLNLILVFGLAGVLGIASQFVRDRLGSTFAK